MNTINQEFDIILPNEFGRKYTKRYKQYMYTDREGVDGIPNWELQNFGCGPAAMATILSSIGYDINPVAVAKIMLMDENGNMLDFYTNKEKERLGMVTVSFLYLLQELVRRNKYDIDYQIVKCSYEHPELKKDEVIDMISSDYMALILVGSKGKGSNFPKTFSEYGHYIAVTSVNKERREFYVANPNKLGDKQIDTTYSYETLVANMYTNTFDFLMVKNKKLSLR